MSRDQVQSAMESTAALPENPADDGIGLMTIDEFAERYLNHLSMEQINEMFQKSYACMIGRWPKR